MSLQIRPNPNIQATKPNRNETFWVIFAYCAKLCSTIYSVKARSLFQSCSHCCCFARALLKVNIAHKLISGMEFASQVRKEASRPCLFLQSSSFLPANSYNRLVSDSRLKHARKTRGCLLFSTRIEILNQLFKCSHSSGKVRFHIVWKLLKMSHLNFWFLAFSTNFCPIKIDLSGNTVWPQASGFQKLAKMDYFWRF